jgi:hypothetical protein
MLGFRGIAKDFDFCLNFNLATKLNPPLAEWFTFKVQAGNTLNGVFCVGKNRFILRFYCAIIKKLKLSLTKKYGERQN